ncbi:aspartate aminotransferase family protein [Pseudoroseomonas globiformis]|uniref:Aspartate aminotransferase family protein n=1 Tax=Teichococcus globiformis TaxID=2307229 RepID=A0ABV7G3V2_9PROT
MDIAAVIAEREAERYTLHSQYLNEQMVRVLKTIGYDVSFKHGAGPYLYDSDGRRYLDLLSGFGVHAIGRNHAEVRKALKAVLDSDLANLVQMDASILAGVLAERLLHHVPYLDKVFFANSGAEAVEAAIKFARCATGRPGIVYAEHAFHGLTYGALALNGDANFRGGFEPMLPGCVAVPFDDLAALDRALAAQTIAAFIVEPIQGKGVNIPSEGYLAEAAALCRKYGTLFVADEIQTGLGRTGRFLAVEHWNVEPDMVLLAKALSGGHVPVGAVLSRKWIFNKIFNRMDRAVVHGSTFSKNDLAMAAGLATLQVLEAEDCVGNATRQGERLLTCFKSMIGRQEFVKDARGKGLMIGIEFGSPQSLKLRAAWSMIESVSTGLFCQLITLPLFKEHKILSQVSGHASHTIKLLPALNISDSDCDWIERAFETTISDSHRVPGAAWSLGKTLAAHAIKAGAGAS